MKLSGKVAVITGAARGIGRACLSRLHAEGEKSRHHREPEHSPLLGIARAEHEAPILRHLELEFEPLRPKCTKDCAREWQQRKRFPSMCNLRTPTMCTCLYTYL